MALFEQAETPAAADAGAEPKDQTEKPKRGDKEPRKRKHGPSKGEGGRPKGAQMPTGAVLKARSKQLEGKLSELLQFPAIPVAMVAESDPLTQAYMLEHFTRSGPRTAAVLVEASETNPQLRALLERITTGGGLLAVFVALTAYVAPPVLWMMGLRVQAAKITQSTTATPQELEAMMAANAAAAAQAAAAEANGTPGAESPAPSPEPDPG